MLSISLKKHTDKGVTHQKYYKCDRCGYITIVRDSSCPICAKDGFKIKMKYPDIDPDSLLSFR